MQLQGTQASLSCLHPTFVERLSAAIREARENGIEASIYSACRPPELGIGGFKDKHKSLHAYGLAVDMSGVGRPCSETSRRWSEIAQKHDIVNPYGWCHAREWNHYQAVGLIGIRNGHPLRSMITAAGPIELEPMWSASLALIAASEDFVTPRGGYIKKAKKKRGKKKGRKCRKRCKRALKAHEVELPPAKYDRPYTGRLIVKHGTNKQVDRWCGGNAWACQEDTARGVCTIWLPTDVGDDGYTRLKRHEIGHCNGWPSHHPGAIRG
jgi:hypothetical protein